MFLGNNQNKVKSGKLDTVKHKLNQQINGRQSILEVKLLEFQGKLEQKWQSQKPIQHENKPTNFFGIGKQQNIDESRMKTSSFSSSNAQNAIQKSRTSIFRHQKTKSSQSHNRHISILTGHEENENKNIALSQNNSPLKTRVHDSGASQHSSNSQDQTASDYHMISSYGQINGHYTSPIGRPDSVMTQTRLSFQKRPKSIEDIEDKFSIYSPQTTSKVLTHSQFQFADQQIPKQFESQYFLSSQPFIGNQQIESKNSVSSHQILSNLELQNCTSATVKISEQESNSNQQSNIHNRVSKKFMKMNEVLHKSHQRHYSRPNSSMKGNLLNHTQNQKTGKDFPISLFENPRILNSAQVQMQKAFDRFNSSSLKNNYLIAHQSNQVNKTISGNIIPSPNISNNITQSLNLLNSQQQINSSTMLIDHKSNKRIIEEIESEMRSEHKQLIQNLLDNDQRYLVYLSSFQKMSRIVETKDIELLVLQVLFLAEMAMHVEDYDKTAFFLGQAKMITDMSRKIIHQKIKIFMLFGDLCIKTSRIMQALTFYKKALQYSWNCNLPETEISVYEKLGIVYFYLQDVKLQDFYHTRFTQSLHEYHDSHIRNISQESLSEYNSQMEYNLNYITPILMIQLQLPVQYSIDKVQLEMRESQFKLEKTQNKRGQNIDDKIQNLMREYQQEIENFVQNRYKVFQIASLAKIIDTVLEEKEFDQTIDTPTFFPKPDKGSDDDSNIPAEVAACQRPVQKKVNMEIHKSEAIFTTEDTRKKKKEWVAPIMKKTTYDISKFGPVKDPRQSQRVFEDTSLYNLSLDKKIEILLKQKISYQKTIEKVSNIVQNNMKFQEQLNQRVRISHLSPNRFDPLKYNTPFYLIASLNKTYCAFLSVLNQYSEKYSSYPKTKEQ